MKDSMCELYGETYDIIDREHNGEDNSYKGVALTMILGVLLKIEERLERIEKGLSKESEVLK